MIENHRVTAMVAAMVAAMAAAMISVQNAAAGIERSDVLTDIQ